MEVKSLKHNFIMYFIRTFFNLGFGIIIFPLVARKLGAENLGKIQYVESIVAYFLLFINLGIDNYGKREVALHRDNREKLEEIVSELFIILIINTFIGISIYFIFIFSYIKDIIIKNILFIFSLNLLLNFLSLEWFFVGIENQTYITKRNLFLKIVSSILILILIKDKKDIYIYSGILVFSLVSMNLFNFYNIKNYISLAKINIRSLKEHFSALVYFFFSVLALSLAYNLDSIMIMKIKGSMELGLYSIASKLGKLPIIFITAVSGVTYPRICNFLQNNKRDEYINLEKNIFNILLIFSIPASLGMFMLSSDIILLFGGKEYVKSIPILQVFSFLILIMSMAVYTGSLTLLANKKEKIVTIALVIGSILNVIFNLIMIPYIGALGAVLATLLIEVIGIIIKVFLAKEIFLELKLLGFNQIKILFSALIMIIILVFLNQYFGISFYNLGFKIIVAGLIYILMLILLKEKLILEVYNKIRREI